ncbi:MAG TPA: secretin N-terminal domain-containing protein [Parachlamydiaceae bacterium]|nr:secretin N-terminal domain-containing protein [Parachlamydiaceae bacterium]
MKISTLISRSVAPAFITAFLSMQYLTGENSFAYNLDSNNYSPSPDVSSILRNKSPSVVHSEDTFTKPESYFYQILDPIAFELVHPDMHFPDPNLIAQDELIAIGNEADQKTVLINFNNVSMIEYIRFVSRISNRNFIFDENDLQFNVTIISEEPATIENIMTALMQELRIHDLLLLEDGNNLIIHRNPKISGISRVASDDIPNSQISDTDLVTQVFRLNTLDTDKAVTLLRPLVSDSAILEPLKDTNQLIVTDITANIQKISTLLKSLDSPNSGLVIGQYVSRLTPIESMIPLVQQIMLPISLDQPLTFVPQTTTNSIFIVSSPFLVERTISILEYLDQDQGATRILNLNDLKLGGAAQINPRVPMNTLSGQWISNAQGNWMFKPATLPDAPPTPIPPVGTWTRDTEGSWNFNPGQRPAAVGTGAVEGGTQAPKGSWVKDKDGNWVYGLEGEEPFNPGTFNRQFQGQARLPGGVQKASKFFIYKLQYRKGDSIEPALRQIADTLQQNERGSEDLINTLRSVQWLATPNSLVFSGTDENLARARQLVVEIDAPMRQVLIEMLILESSLQDSLNFGVSYSTRFGGGDVAGAQGFAGSSSPLAGALSTAGLGPIASSLTNLPQVLTPDASSLTQNSGFNLGVIGQKIIHCGTEFSTFGALVKALHDRTRDKVISTPKILVEDNAPAELFVGINTPYRTQSISNDFGSVITSNFEYRDVGTRLRVTPYLGNGDIIAMDIEEEVSTIIAGLISNAATAGTSPGPTTRINRTTTRVHIPDNYFLIISGMMQNDSSRARNQIPCLGGIPLLGAAFSEKRNTDQKRNLMIFIRPKIVDTEEEIQNITKHQQDLYRYKNCLKNSDEYETVEALDLFNVKKTLHPEDCYECDCDCSCCD